MNVSKRIVAVFMSIFMLVSFAQVSFAEESDYNKIKNYINTIAPTGEITINNLTNTLKIGTSASDLTSEDIRVKLNTSLTYSSTLDMSNVREKYNSIISVINLLDSDLKDIVNNSSVSGKFIIDIIYDKVLNISSLTENNFVDLNSNIFDSVNMSITYPTNGSIKIEVPILADKKASNISSDMLSDITYQMSNVKPTTNGGPYSVKVSMTGYVAFNADSQEYARITFTSPETIRNVTVYTSSGGGSGRPSTTNKTVKFDTDGGSSIPNQTIASGSNASAPVAPTKEGYIFSGWYTDAEFTKPFDFNSKVSEDITLYAKWIKSEESSNKPTAVIKGIENQEIIFNEDNTIDFSKIKTPVREGFIFGGWYTDESFQNEVTENTVLVNGNIYGKWINNRTPKLLNATDHISYINGYPDETVRPENNITREEVAAIIYRLMTDTAKKDFSGKEAVFSDIKKDSWSYNSVSAIAAAGLISGYEDNTFKPQNAITRAEFAAILSRLYEDVDVTYAMDFSDITGHWAEDSIKKLSALECISGYEDNRFRPEQLISRAEAITIINRMLVRYANKDAVGTYTNTWSDNNENKWYYYAVIEATNAHEYDRAEDQYNENWN